VTPVGKCHTTLDVALGPAFLTVKVGSHAHWIRWDRPRLEVRHNTSGDPDTLLAAGAGRHAAGLILAAVTRGADALRDPALGQRFTQGCTAFGLTVLVDSFGEIAVCDAGRSLVCMFFVFRDKVAAWMPDGTRVGPLSIVGGPSTPDGLERIAAALRAAQAVELGGEGLA
jgi:hypothetical protein